VGLFTLGLPILFAVLDRMNFPGLKWVQEGDPTPIWGHLVVVVGVALAVLVALAAPISGFQSAH
jgi:hypothetical protein